MGPDDLFSRIMDTKCTEYNDGDYVFGDEPSGLTEMNHFTEQSIS